MITPVFEIQQDDHFLTIQIKAPFTKVKDAEIFIEDCEFRFYSKPYFLRLNLPAAIVDDDRAKANYDTDTGYFTVVVAKAEPGRNFEGLGMLTKLLAPSRNTHVKQPLIEVIDGESHIVEDVDNNFDWQIEQVPAPDELSHSGQLYGFANLKSGVLSTIKQENPDIVDVPDPDSTSWEHRNSLQAEEELVKFSEDHYMADLMYDDAIIPELLRYNPSWCRMATRSITVIVLTEDEREQMKNLPQKELMLTKVQQKVAFLGLVDIMFAYAYNHRTTQGDNTVESGWTIAKLSSTLSWLRVFTNLREVAVCCYKRSLCYPLYRNWSLTKQVWLDMCSIFECGQMQLLKSLLEIHKIFNQGDSRYILNDLYITDYCIWIQHISSQQLAALAAKLKEVQILKLEINLDLELIEQSAYLAARDSNCTESISQSLAALDLATSVSHITELFTRDELYVQQSREILELASSTDSEDDTDSDATSFSEDNAMPTIPEERPSDLHNNSKVDERSLNF